MLPLLLASLGACASTPPDSDAGFRSLGRKTAELVDRETGKALSEGGFGGCIVFRELLQHPDGTLGTKFPPELIPPRGEPVDCPRQVRVAGTSPLKGLPRDFYLKATLKPAGAAAFGCRLRGGSVVVRPADRRVETPKGAIEGMDGLDRPFGIEIIRKGDVLDVCVDRRRTRVLRLKDPGGDEMALFAETGELVVDELEVRPLR